MKVNEKNGNLTAVIDLVTFDGSAGSAELLKEEGNQKIVRWISYSPCYKGTVVDEKIYTSPTIYHNDEIAEVTNRRLMEAKEVDALRNMCLKDEKACCRDKKFNICHIDVEDVELIRDMMNFLTSSLKNMIGDTAVASVIDSDVVRQRTDLQEIEPLIGQVIDIYEDCGKKSVELYPAKKKSNFTVVIHIDDMDDKDFDFSSEPHSTLVAIHEYIRECMVTGTLNKVDMRKE